MTHPAPDCTVTFPGGLPRGAWADGYVIQLLKVDDSRANAYLTRAEVSYNGARAEIIGVDLLSIASRENFEVVLGGTNGVEPILWEQRLKAFYFAIQDAQAAHPPPWPPLQALPSLLPEVPAMPGSLLPPGLRPWLEDIAERMQVPLEYAAIPAVVAAGALIGRQIGVYPKAKDDWLVVPNLWGAIVGRSGLLKSPTLDQALKPLDRLAVAAMEAHTQQQETNAALEERLDTQIAGVKEALKKAAKTQDQAQLAETMAQLESLQAERADLACTLRRFKTNDATIEKLGELLKENPQGLLLFRDELSGWLSSLRQEGRETDRSFFLEAWNGDKDFTVDRISRGTTYIPALCLSLVGGLQPGKLMRYVYEACEGGEGDDGLLQRFQLLVWPNPEAPFTYIDRYPDGARRDHAYTLYERLTTLDPGSLGAVSGTYQPMPGLHFTPAAQQVFTAWVTELEQRLRGAETETPAFESHLAKYRSLMPSLALIFHLIRKMEGDWEGDAIAEDMAKLAIDWCDFLESHARKVYTGILHKDLQAAHALGMKIRQGAITEGQSPRDIYRNRWTLLRTPDDVYGGLTQLEAYGWLRVTEDSRRTQGGRPRERLELHPDLRERGTKPGATEGASQEDHEEQEEQE